MRSRKKSSDTKAANARPATTLNAAIRAHRGRRTRKTGRANGFVVMELRDYSIRLARPSGPIVRPRCGGRSVLGALALTRGRARRILHRVLSGLIETVLLPRLHPRDAWALRARCVPLREASMRVVVAVLAVLCLCTGPAI